MHAHWYEKLMENKPLEPPKPSPDPPKSSLERPGTRKKSPDHARLFIDKP